MATDRSPAIRIYRRVSTRFGPLRDLLTRNDFHPISPPDAIAEWECCDDRGTRVRFFGATLLVEALDDAVADDFDARHRMALPSDRFLPDGGEPPDRVKIIAGSDESGKGERDRALCVAAVALPISAEAEAITRGVRDSKLCDAKEIIELAQWIAAHFTHTVRAIASLARAEALRAHGANESRLLAAMHADCLSEVHDHAPFLLARVDRFAPNRPVAAKLVGKHALCIVDECIRGERHVACAAASILARAATLRS